MNLKDYGNRADKTRCEVVDLLRVLSEQLRAVCVTIDDIADTLYNEEYEDIKGEKYDD